VYAPPLNTGVGVPDKHALEYWYKHVHQRVLHDTVRREGQDIDCPFFRLVQYFFMIAGSGKRLVAQRPLHLVNVGVYVPAERPQAGKARLVPPGLSVRRPDIVCIRYAGEKIAVPYHKVRAA
jgi:hypothetical protein